MNIGEIPALIAQLYSRERNGTLGCREVKKKLTGRLPANEDSMKKSTLIATFLVNLRGGFDLEQAEHAVAITFAEKYLASDFHAWNTELDDQWCENVIKGEPSPSYVNVENFILRLWDMR